MTAIKFRNVTVQVLHDIERAYQGAQEDAERLRADRNAAIRQAIAEDWTHARIAEATGLTRSRVGQIAK